MNSMLDYKSNSLCEARVRETRVPEARFELATDGFEVRRSIR